MFARTIFHPSRPTVQVASRLITDSCVARSKKGNSFKTYVKELNSSSANAEVVEPSVRLKTPEFDHNVIKEVNLTGNPDLPTLLNPKNRSKIVQNLVSRLIVPSETEAENMLSDLQDLKASTVQNPSTRDILVNKACEFPNMSHPAVVDYTEPLTIFDNTSKWAAVEKLNKVRSFEEVGQILHGLRTTNTGQTTSEKSYYLIGPLAELEQALIRYTLDILLERFGFSLISVPDLVHPDIMKACGIDVEGKITQVYQLDPRFYGKVALSGTAEMAFGEYFHNQNLSFESNLPAGSSFHDRVRKHAAVSRCYRAESTLGKSESGIYRVHHFTKVEMFAVTQGDANVSNLVQEQMLVVQQKLFDDLNLSYRALDMHPGDLGAPAARKFDCEALLPGRTTRKGEPFYGEISSTSNCTDYQSRRLNIREEATGQFCHTVNGTACAIPRMIMAICEQFQLANGCVLLPPKLRPYMSSMRQQADDDMMLRPRPKQKRVTCRYYKSPNFSHEAS